MRKRFARCYPEIDWWFNFNVWNNKLNEGKGYVQNLQVQKAQNLALNFCQTLTDPQKVKIYYATKLPRFSQTDWLQHPS